MIHQNQHQLKMDVNNYSDYLSEQIDRLINGNRSNLTNSISYAEYIAEQIDRNISYSEYLASEYPKNIKRKTKIKNLFK